jgi:hypothetical protein
MHLWQHPNIRNLANAKKYKEEEGDEEGVEDTDSNPSGNEERKEKSEEIAQPSKKTRSGRTIKPPLRYNLYTQGNKETEYSIKTAKVITKAMNYFNYAFLAASKHPTFSKSKKITFSFIETFGLKRELKHFGKKGCDASFSEAKQLHDRVEFIPVNVSKLTPQGIKRAMESLMFLVEKHDGRVKSQWCAYGSTQQSYTSKEDAASSTTLSESVLIKQKKEEML